MSFAHVGCEGEGQFIEKEYGHTFEYIKLDPESPFYNPWAEKIGATHTIYVGTDQERFARILKTVAYVAVDEDENGAVWEKWHIKRNREYEKRYMV